MMDCRVAVWHTASPFSTVMAAPRLATGQMRDQAATHDEVRRERCQP